MNLKPYESLLIGRAAFDNAREYLEQADLLAGRGWHGRATALAILGEEELGKANYFTLLATGRLKFKPKAIHEALRVHTAKQRMSQVHVVVEACAKNPTIAQFFTDVLGPAVQELPDELSPDGEERMRHLFADIRARIDAHVAANPDIEQAFKSEMKNALEAAWIDSLDPLKFLGLYVDFDWSSRHVSSPTEVTREQAEARRTALRKKIATYSDSTPVINDEETLTQFRRMTGVPEDLTSQ